MNVKEAKEQIENALSVYTEKDSHGHYVVPKEKQRPIFLIGPPGIGKTAIMEQIAHGMQLPLLCYSMTHHTRQSALGLPFISKREYNGTQYSIQCRKSSLQYMICRLKAVSKREYYFWMKSIVSLKH